MIDVGYYAATPEVAQRAGLSDLRYRTVDGRYILDNRDLERISLRSQEFLTGISGVEPLSRQEAKTLIAEGGYKMGRAFVDEPMGNSWNIPEDESDIEEMNEFDSQDESVEESVETENENGESVNEGEVVEEEAAPVNEEEEVAESERADSEQEAGKEDDV